ncbi:hypothetical protein L596_015268 [Steinernema carpocapsae]|uniref:Uncharacterized protein n=1 Tax=Steinernema carpocapsae TaxID=34508 RepID=A0A4U5NFH4_STECR|nr:hypothetical protein L596_015268 [Steinernema carpocapsae]
MGKKNPVLKKYIKGGKHWPAWVVRSATFGMCSIARSLNLISLLAFLKEGHSEVRASVLSNIDFYATSLLTHPPVFLAIYDDKECREGYYCLVVYYAVTFLFCISVGSPFLTEAMENVICISYNILSP